MSQAMMKALHNYKAEARRLVAEKRKARSISAPHPTPKTPSQEASLEEEEEFYPGEQEEEAPLEENFEEAEHETPSVTVVLSSLRKSAKQKADDPPKRGPGRPRKEK